VPGTGPSQAEIWKLTVNIGHGVMTWWISVSQVLILVQDESMEGKVSKDMLYLLIA
jgi:hypothetical protein